ncbi:MAG: NUDIX hydrolase [Candidatus Sericytochromatia bacterium]
MASVRALIIREGRVLMLQRGEEISLPGHWCLPGGRIDLDESPEAACVREVKEETGLEIRVIRRLHRAGSCHYFLCDAGPIAQPICLQAEECQAYHWADPGLIHRVGPIMDMPSLRHLLRKMGL